MYGFNCLRIGKWVLEYNNLSSHSNYFDFPWKLDAFIYDEINRVNFTYITDLEVLYKNNTIEKGRFIYEKYNGFNRNEIYINKCGDISWLLKRNSTKETILHYEVSSDWSNWKLIKDVTKTNGIYAFEYLHQIFSYSVLNYGGIVLHGVLMEHEGKGIIISAPSGTGKTTHARMWRNNENALIINGDRALCGKDDDSGKWTGYGMPWCGTSGEYINRKVPISAIVVLERGEENSVERLDILDGFIHMLPNVMAPVWEESMMKKAMDMLQDIVENIPVYKLKCRPDLDAVNVLKAEIDKL